MNIKCNCYGETCGCAACESERRENRPGPSTEGQSVVIYAKAWRETGDPLYLLNARVWVERCIGASC